MKGITKIGTIAIVAIFVASLFFVVQPVGASYIAHSAKPIMPSVKIIVPLDGEKMNQNDIVTIQASVKSGLPVTVVADITLPNDDVEQIIFSRIGEELYEGVFTSTSQAGQYNVIVTATNTIGKKRSDSINFIVEDGGVTCDSQADCNAKLNGQYPKVTLVNDILNCAGTCIVFGADNIVFDGGSIQNMVIDGDNDALGNGIDLNGHSGIIIQNAEIKEFDIAVYSDGGNNNQILNTYVHHNQNEGIFWTNGNGFIVEGNICEWNKNHGIAAISTSNSLIENNAVQLNEGGGIAIVFSTSNTIKNNDISSNGKGNKYGIHMMSSNGNLIYNNNIVSNSFQANDNGDNLWDNGYPIGGNYWDDYSNSCSDSDQNGFCDLPYSIPGGSNQDHFVSVVQW